MSFLTSSQFACNSVLYIDASQHNDLVVMFQELYTTYTKLCNVNSVYYKYRYILGTFDKNDRVVHFVMHSPSSREIVICVQYDVACRLIRDFYHFMQLRHAKLYNSWQRFHRVGHDSSHVMRWACYFINAQHSSAYPQTRKVLKRKKHPLDNFDTFVLDEEEEEELADHSRAWTHTSTYFTDLYDRQVIGLACIYMYSCYFCIEWNNKLLSLQCCNADLSVRSYLLQEYQECTCHRENIPVHDMPLDTCGLIFSYLCASLLQKNIHIPGLVAQYPDFPSHYIVNCIIRIHALYAHITQQTKFTRTKLEDAFIKISVNIHERVWRHQRTTYTNKWKNAYMCTFDDAVQNVQVLPHLSRMARSLKYANTTTIILHTVTSPLDVQSCIEYFFPKYMPGSDYCIGWKPLQSSMKLTMKSSDLERFIILANFEYLYATKSIELGYHIAQQYTHNYDVCHDILVKYIGRLCGTKKIVPLVLMKQLIHHIVPTMHDLVRDDCMVRFKSLVQCIGNSSIIFMSLDSNITESLTQLLASHNIIYALGNDDRIYVTKKVEACIELFMDHTDHDYIQYIVGHTIPVTKKSRTTKQSIDNDNDTVFQQCNVFIACLYLLSNDTTHCTLDELKLFIVSLQQRERLKLTSIPMISSIIITPQSISKSQHVSDAFTKNNIPRPYSDSALYLLEHVYTNVTFAQLHKAYAK